MSAIHWLAAQADLKRKLLEPWQLVMKKETPFLAIPPEVHLLIFEWLNPIDAVCLSIVNKYIYSITPKVVFEAPLRIGSPNSDYPVIEKSGCRHCVPVLYYPAHCELSFHLRSSIPPELTYCGGPCEQYTTCEDKGYSDSNLICRACGVPYAERFERGRKILDRDRPGEKQVKLRTWYNG